MHIETQCIICSVHGAMLHLGDPINGDLIKSLYFRVAIDRTMPERHANVLSPSWVQLLGQVILVEV
jgi:hypothetical protein